MTKELTKNPFPAQRKTPGGGETTIINAVCECRCFQTDHNDTLVFGHGSCALCECIQFTWIGNVAGGSSDKVDEAVAGMDRHQMAEYQLKRKQLYSDVEGELEHARAAIDRLTDETHDLSEECAKEMGKRLAFGERIDNQNSVIRELKAKIDKMTLKAIAIDIGKRRILPDPGVLRRSQEKGRKRAEEA